MNVGLLVRLEAKPGKESELESFLRDALPLVQAERATTAWFALRLGTTSFGIFDLFPDDYLIVLVRDGRAVVESKQRSFGETFESAAREWAAGAETILRFAREHASTRGTR